VQKVQAGIKSLIKIKRLCGLGLVQAAQAKGAKGAIKN